MQRAFTFSVAVLLAIASGPLWAQKNTVLSTLEASAEAGALLSSNGETPFWLTTNQFGAVPDRATAGILQGTIRRNYAFYDSLAGKPRKFDWKAGLAPVAYYNKENNFQLILPEAHAGVRFKQVELWVGRRREVIGLGDSTLSSGFYANSGNALPMPKLQIGTVGFAPLKFTKNFVAINAGFAHGWFHTDYIQGVRLHQKYVYLRFGNKKTKVYAGLNHNVMWAGHSEYLKMHPELAVNGKLPSSWSIYPNVVLAFTSKNWFEKNGYGAFDSYRVGNHLGSYDIAFETSFGDKKLFVYHQHPFEDVSSMLFKNIPDGLFGINLKMKPKYAAAGFSLTHLTLEFLSTKDQSGSEFYIPGSKYQGADNYFNHTQYYEGWSYQGRTIGTPFIIPGKDMDQSKISNYRYFPNNRVTVWYAGAQGKVGRALALTLRVSFSRNYGTFETYFEPPRRQFSGLLAAQYPLPGLANTSIIGRIALDQGDIFTTRTGGYIGVRKSW